MKALRTFARGGDGSLQEAHVRLRRLITATHDVTEQQAIQHWYNILDKVLKTLVRNEALQMGKPPSLQFVFETSKQIEINLLEGKPAMDFLKREEKPPEKVKVAKANLPSHAVDTNAIVSNVAKQDICGRIAKRARLPHLKAEILFWIRYQTAQRSQVLEGPPRIEVYGE
jgi:N-glycosylase/DNA lyase